MFMACFNDASAWHSSVALLEGAENYIAGHVDQAILANNMHLTRQPAFRLSLEKLLADHATFTRLVLHSQQQRASTFPPWHFSFRD